MAIPTFTLASTTNPVRHSANYVVGFPVFTLKSESPAVVQRWLNIGWNASTKVHEQWITNPTPSTTPPSGHTLTGIASYPIGSS